MTSVLLVHGMGRSAASMLLMAHRLRLAGFKPILFNYVVSVESLETICARLLKKAQKLHPPFFLIGHSLGGLLARMAYKELYAQGLQKIVMLGPPNTPPLLAESFQNNPIFKTLTGDAGRKLRRADFYATLSIPTIPTLIFAGNSGPRSQWLPFHGQASDGVVTVEETRLEGATHRVVPGIHTFLMNDRAISDEIVQFFQTPLE